MAIPGGPVREHLRCMLLKAGAAVDLIEPSADLWDTLRSHDTDLVVVRRCQVPPGGMHVLEDVAGGKDDPGIVVLSEESGPADRARLIAAGASEVLDPSTQQNELPRVLTSVAQVELEGGRDGPDVAGSRPEPRLADFHSRSPAMQDFLSLVERVVDARTTLLITGETGVGKERLARAIHAEGPRSAGPFVTVNCGALPESLLESELFGHEKGAFTGADRRRKGRFESAAGGTILLDEISEMPPLLQVKLLTVLQRHEVQRLGREQPVPVDVRVIAATNVSLEQKVRDGSFREDLLYRLNVMKLEIPPLRMRKQDIPDLVGNFIRHFKRITPSCEVAAIGEAAMQALLEYHWPGNVRELVNVIERAMLLARGAEITVDDLPREILGPGHDTTGSAEASAAIGTAGSPQGAPEDWAGVPLKQARDRLVARFERKYLRNLLRETGGNIGKTAKRAGIGARSLYDKMKRYDLRKEDFRS